MMARSRPRARIAALNAAARFAPDAEMITGATAPVKIPTAAGWVRRQCSEASAAIPTTMATTRSHGGCSVQVSTSVAAPITNASRYVIASTMRSRRPRAASGSSLTTAGSAKRIEPDSRWVTPAVCGGVIARDEI